MPTSLATRRKIGFLSVLGLLEDQLNAPYGIFHLPLKLVYSGCLASLPDVIALKLNLLAKYNS